MKQAVLTAEEAKRLILGKRPGRTCRVQASGQRANLDVLFAQGGSASEVQSLAKELYDVEIGEHALRAHRYRACPCYPQEATRAKAR